MVWVREWSSCYGYLFHVVVFVSLFSNRGTKMMISVTPRIVSEYVCVFRSLTRWRTWSIVSGQQEAYVCLIQFARWRTDQQLLLVKA